jgi:hypothetical protein
MHVCMGVCIQLPDAHGLGVPARTLGETSSVEVPVVCIPYLYYVCMATPLHTTCMLLPYVLPPVQYLQHTQRV